MSNISTLSLNLLLEQVYLEGQINLMYEEILREDDNISDEESKSMVKKVIDDLKLNADFMFTFGVGISAFAGPVSELLSNGGIHITKYDVTLLIITAFYILLTKSKEDVDTLMAKVKEHKLESHLKKVVKFIYSTVDLFKVVGNKVGVTITTLVDVLAFTFMSVPVLNLIKNLAAEKGFNIDNVSQLFAGVLLSAGTYLIKNMLKKRLKESEDLEWAQDTVKPFAGKIKKIGEDDLFKILKDILKDTKFVVSKEVFDNSTVYELNDGEGGTYVDFRSEDFTIKNIRHQLVDDIKTVDENVKKHQTESMIRVLEEYIELYEILKPILFNDKPYTKKVKPDTNLKKRAPKKRTP
jgi:hypothetical protein